MGGMQVLEWAVMHPGRVRSIVPIATTTASTAQQIAFGAIGRRAIALDPKWRDGDYYDAEPGDGPHAGMGIARSIAQITYRSDAVFSERFGRDVADTLDGFDQWQRFEVESYLGYHGVKLARRFDANSYLLLAKSMDLFDLGRGRGGVERALDRMSVPALTMGITSDVLYPPYQQWEMRDALRARGLDVEYAEIDSPHGHDAFLLEFDQVGRAIARFLTDVEKSDA